MSNNINQLPSSLPVSSTTASTDISVQNNADVNDVSSVADVRLSKSASANAAVQDAYGVIPVGTRGNVLSTQPPVPTDAASVGPTSLRSAQSKMAYLAEGGTAGSQALALNAENPSSTVNLTGGQPTSAKAATLGSNASSSSASSSTSQSTSSSNTGLYNETTSASSGTTSQQAQDSTDATSTSDKWIKNVGKKCKHSDKDMAAATGLPQATAKQAYNLMKNDNTKDYAQQVGTAMAVLAQEKKDGSPSYKADAAKITSALQTMTDNADSRGSTNSNSGASVKTFDSALSSLSSVVTARLGADPSGGAPKSDPFDPTNKVSVVNSWA